MLCTACNALDFNLTVLGHDNRLFTVLHKSRASFSEALILGCDFCLLVSSKLEGTEVRNQVCDQLGAFIVLSCFREASQTQSGTNRSGPVALTAISRLGTAILDVIDPIPGMNPPEPPAIPALAPLMLYLTDDYSFIYANTTPLSSQSHHQHVKDSAEPAAKRQKLNASSLSQSSNQPVHVPGNTHTGSSENLQLAKFWLDECIRNHSHCSVNHGSQATPFVPTRLINLTSPDKPFLEETGGKREGPFVALSYTWGIGDRVLTKTDNISSHKQCLPMHKLPNTFAHAIHVARSLGYTYLWTDAFCIIQDDDDDKVQEIKNMGDIYRYAEFTIYAQNAESSWAGFFVDRDPRQYRPCKLPVSITADGKSVKQELTLATTCNGPDHLKPRGWILQEWVLSSRCLIFGKQMAWICSVCEAQETNPVLRPRKAHAQGSSAWGLEKMRSSLYGTVPTVTGPRNPQTLASQFDLWYNMLEEYGDKKLTSENDIIAAVAGLANLFEKQHGASFERGLWREDLQFGLAWYVSSNEPRPVSKTPKQPSWSWASVGKVRIKFRSWRSTKGPLEDVGCKIVRIDDGPGSSPEEKSRTIITLQAPVLKGKLSYSAVFSDARQKKSLGGPGPEFDGIDTREHPRYPALLLGHDTNQPVAEVALDRPFKVMQPPANPNGTTTLGTIVDVECILLYAQRAFFDQRGTVLIVKLDEEKKVYKRVGLGFVVGKYMSWLGISKTDPCVDPAKEIATREIRIM